MGPLISRFVQQYPQVDVQLQLSGDPPSLSDDAFDVCIRFGPPTDARVIARKIASNQRVLSGLCGLPGPAQIGRAGAGLCGLCGGGVQASQALMRLFIFSAEMP